MHRYPPSPVSMQVALPAQGLDEHRRVSVVKKKKNKHAVFRSCVCSFSLPVSPSPPLFPLSHSHSPPQHLVSKNKSENTNQRRYTGRRLICSSLQQNKRFTVRVLIRRSNWARSQENLSSSNLFRLFLLLLEGQPVIPICDNVQIV